MYTNSPLLVMEKMSGNAPLCDADPELYGLIKQEKNRQRSCLELIASENFTSKAVMDAVSGHCSGFPVHF